MPDLRLANLFHADGFSDLHGPIVKAASTRALIPWMVELTTTFFAGSSQEEVSIRKVAHSLHEIVNTLYSAGIFLTAGEKRHVRYHMLRYSRHYQWLSTHNSEDKGLTWHVKPKHHYFQHIADQLDLLNPRYVQNYLEEGIVGATANVYKASCSGPVDDARLQYTVLIKLRASRYLRGLGVGDRPW